MRDLTEDERDRLVEVRERLSHFDSEAHAERRTQEKLWRRLVKAGVSKSEIARISGVSATAVRVRLTRTAPSVPARGSGGRRR